MAELYECTNYHRSQPIRNTSIVGFTYAFNSDRTVVGHIDAGLLGAIQASEDGDVVNHMLCSP
jgi:acyl CoA:acetate/3-ketoacid CoA transferase beta subunit